MGKPTLQLTGYPAPEHTHPYILSSDHYMTPRTQYQTVSITHLHWRGKVYIGDLRTGDRAPEKVVVKLAVGSDRFYALNNEAQLYNNDLRTLQGTVVPKCYGFYTAKVEVNGRRVQMGCLLLELCNASGTRMEEPEKTRYNWSRMDAVRRLHEAGVTHGSIVQGYHHFVQQGLEARIVDFSLAGRRHKCHWERPCLELRAMQQNLLGTSYGD